MLYLLPHQEFAKRKEPVKGPGHHNFYGPETVLGTSLPVQIDVDFDSRNKIATHLKTHQTNKLCGR